MLIWLKEWEYNKDKKKIKKVSTTYKIGKEFISFGNIEVEKQISKVQFSYVDIKEIIIISAIVPFGKKSFKYFIGYEDNDKVAPLYIMLPKMSKYRSCFEWTKYISFLIKMIHF